ncbi:MAG: hypothetical protein N2484_17050 [Clostridia bacterium]|nr:hypothetical protein [Clostridia bacterium]
MTESLHGTQVMYWNQSYQRWAAQELFSFGWFFNIVFLIVLYTVWIKIVDKRRIKELLLFGSFISVAAGFVDVIAVSSGLWEYKIRLFPINPATFPFDYTVVPIFYMIVMQYTSSWRGYLIGSLLAAGVFAFVISPIYINLGIKQYHNFNYFYMFLLVFGVTTFIKTVYNWLTKIEFKNARY